MREDAYSAAGVNIAAGNQAADAIADLTKSQKDPHILAGVGGFGSVYAVPTGFKQPVLVSGTDGVGTKVLVAIVANQVRSIGQDLVAMCVNDILAQGALPMYFLDYLGIHQVQPEQVKDIVAGVQAACQIGQLALIGGETAEMPDMYAKNHFDLAGFAVGIAEKSALFQPSTLQVGDVVLALPSSGLHSNGFSLVRKILFKDHQFDLDTEIPELNTTLKTELLKPTRIYTAELKALIQNQLIAGAAHITGGGLIENLPRTLPDNLAAQLEWGSWPILPIFAWLQQLGQLSLNDMLETFNLGVGMTLIVRQDKLAAVKAQLTQQQTDFYEIGQLIPRKTDAVIFNGKAPL